MAYRAKSVLLTGKVISILKQGVTMMTTRRQIREQTCVHTLLINKGGPNCLIFFFCNIYIACRG